MTTRRHDEGQTSWLKRVGWLVMLWVLGVAGLALIAWLIRVFMNWTGFSA